MSISKRLRYEVLRRDNYSCRYCGATASDGARLTIDHVVPESLGGTDEPGNLVAACRDCNAGKASTRPDEPLVDDAQQAAIRYANAVRQAAADLEAAQAPERDYRNTFHDEWQQFRYGLNYMKGYPLPADWEASLNQFHRAGLPIEAVVDAVHMVMAKPAVAPDSKWRYFCGICWNRVRDIHSRALEILATEDDGMTP